jgi:hypothetical protein
MVNDSDPTNEKNHCTEFETSYTVERTLQFLAGLLIKVKVSRSCSAIIIIIIIIFIIITTTCKTTCYNLIQYSDYYYNNQLFVCELHSEFSYRIRIFKDQYFLRSVLFSKSIDYNISNTDTVIN